MARPAGFSCSSSIRNFHPPIDSRVVITGHVKNDFQVGIRCIPGSHPSYYSKPIPAGHRPGFAEPVFDFLMHTIRRPGKIKMHYGT